MRIAIVGGGFVGTAVACHLLRNANTGTELTLLNAGGRDARGLAYGTRSTQHVLNVPAARMSWTADLPNGFIDWLTDHDLPFHGHDFVPRSCYGDYLTHTLNTHVQLRPDLVWEQRQETVTGIRRGAGSSFALQTGSGRHLEADRIVLASGNFAPNCPHHSLRAMPARSYVADPWHPQALADLSPDASVLIIGTGLTMLDVLVSLREGGHSGPVLALSRRGLLPRPHRSNELPPPGWRPSAPWPLPAGLRGLFRQIRNAADEAKQDGFDWRDVWVALRSQTPQLWRTMPDRDRAQFLRHAQALWDTHRHRAAPAAIEALDRALQSGQLTIAAGRLLDSMVEGSRARMRWRERKHQQEHVVIVDRVFNCSGPSSHIANDSSALFAELHRQDMLLPCPLGLGIKVDDAYRLRDAAGIAQDGLYYAGPLLKSQYWEATAVPELRLHAAAVAHHCLNDPKPAQRSTVEPPRCDK